MLANKNRLRHHVVLALTSELPLAAAFTSAAFGYKPNHNPIPQGPGGKATALKAWQLLSKEPPVASVLRRELGELSQ